MMAIDNFVAETLVKPGGLLVRSCNPTQCPRATSSLANLSRSVVPNVSNCSKYRILSKVSSSKIFPLILFLLFKEKK